MNALNFEVKSSVKVVGANGQISLGKDYAGRQVLVEEFEPGVWHVRTALVIPENERWLHGQQVSRDVDMAMSWAAKTTPQTTNVDDLFDGVNNGRKHAAPARKARSEQPGLSKKSV